MSVGRLNEINSLSKNNWLAGNSALRLTHRLLINVTNKLPTGPEESSHLYYFFIFYQTRISRFSLRNKKKQYKNQRKSKSKMSDLDLKTQLELLDGTVFPTIPI